jgi:hypothetical protein
VQALALAAEEVGACERGGAFQPVLIVAYSWLSGVYVTGQEFKHK